MAGTGDVDARAPRAPVSAVDDTASGAAGIERFVGEIGRRLRDLPKEERAATESDLVHHLREAGTRTYEECVQRWGDPAAYADGLRDGLGLPPFRPGGWRKVAALIVVVVALAAVLALWWSSRPDRLPENFAPLQPMASMAAGSSVQSAGTGMLIELRDVEGDAHLVVVLRNDSDRAVRVERIGIPLIRALANGTSTIGGSADEPLRPGEVELSALWTTDVRIEAVPDPYNAHTAEHERMGRPFTPFTWEPSLSYAISVAGPVAACRAELAPFDQWGGDVQVEFTIDNTFLTGAIGTWSLDTTAC